MAATLRVAGRRVRVRVFRRGVFEGAQMRPYTVSELPDGRIRVNVNGLMTAKQIAEQTARAMTEVFDENDAALCRSKYVTKVYVPTPVPSPTPVQSPAPRCPYVGDVD